MKNNRDVTVPFSLDVHQGLTWEQTKTNNFLKKRKRSERSSNGGDGVMEARVHTIPHFWPKAEGPQDVRKRTI